MRLKVSRTGTPASVRPLPSMSAPASRYDVFDLDPAPGATVLSLLFEARDHYDDSLAFRYSCRGAVCGSCAMLINGVPRLACRTQVASLLGRGSSGQESQGSGLPEPGKKGTVPDCGALSDGDCPHFLADEVLVEPLPHLPVLRDLVVDMTSFFEFLRAVQPVLHPASPFSSAQRPASLPEREYRMDPSAVNELERYTNCILCGACYGACPVCGENPEYLGPAALAQLYRFHIDPREARDGSRLALADRPDGWWACRFFAKCRDVCPKAVPPNLAIGQARQELKPGNPHPVPLSEGERSGEGGRNSTDPLPFTKRGG